MGSALRWMKGNKWIVIAAATVLGIAFYYGYRWDGASTDTGSAMETAKATKGDIFVSVTGSGQVQAKSQVDLRPVAAGDSIEVLSVRVKNDQEVKEDDLIAVLDTRDAEKSIRDAELSLRSAEIKMRQTEKDFAGKTEDDKLARQTQEVAFAQSQNRLSDAREDLRDYYIRAPFDGIVTGLSVDAGDSISRTETLASVITRQLVARVSLNEVDAVDVHVGDQATLTFDALDSVTAMGTVSKIDTIGTVSQNVVYYEAEISFSEMPEKLKPGMNVSAIIVTDSKEDVLTVPSSAIKSDASGEYVLIPSGTGVGVSTKRQEVETGSSDGIVTEIVSGLSAGDTVVTKLPAASVSTSSTQSQGLLQSVVRTPGSGGGR